MRERKEDSLTGQIRTERKRWRPATNLRLPNQPKSKVKSQNIICPGFTGTETKK